VSLRADDLVEARPFHPARRAEQRDRRAEQGGTRVIFFRSRPGDTAKITRVSGVIRAAYSAVIFDYPYNDGDARAVIVAPVCFAIADCADLVVVPTSTVNRLREKGIREYRSAQSRADEGGDYRVDELFAAGLPVACEPREIARSPASGRFTACTSRTG
jgi:hypothetical protein